MRRPRGHLLVEVLVASAVALLVGATLLGGLAQSNEHQARALHAQAAAAVAQVKLEQLRAAPLTDAAWAVGTTVVNPQPGYTLTTVVSAVAETPPGSLALDYRRATLTVAWKAETFMVETLKW